jgi:hypothetical protein
VHCVREGGAHPLRHGAAREAAVVVHSARPALPAAPAGRGRARGAWRARAALRAPPQVSPAAAPNAATSAPTPLFLLRHALLRGRRRAPSRARRSARTGALPRQQRSHARARTRRRRRCARLRRAAAAAAAAAAATAAARRRPAAVSPLHALQRGR